MVAQIGPVPSINEQSQVKQNIAIQQLFTQVTLSPLVQFAIAHVQGTSIVLGADTSVYVAESCEISTGIEIELSTDTVLEIG